jgi:ribosomal protein L29
MDLVWFISIFLLGLELRRVPALIRTAPATVAYVVAACAATDGVLRFNLGPVLPREGFDPARALEGVLAFESYQHLALLLFFLRSGPDLEVQVGSRTFCRLLAVMAIISLGLRSGMLAPAQRPASMAPALLFAMIAASKHYAALRPGKGSERLMPWLLWVSCVLLQGFPTSLPALFGLGTLEVYEVLVGLPLALATELAAPAGATPPAGSDGTGLAAAEAKAAREAADRVSNFEKKQQAVKDELASLRAAAALGGADVSLKELNAKVDAKKAEVVELERQMAAAEAEMKEAQLKEAEAAAPPEPTPTAQRPLWPRVVQFVSLLWLVLWVVSDGLGPGVSAEAGRRQCERFVTAIDLSEPLTAQLVCRLPWTSAGSPLDLRWISAGSPLDLRWISAGSPLDLRWISAGSPLDLPPPAGVQLHLG